jgi:ATP-dependent DNA helicase RecG
MPRNPALAQIVHDTNLAETKGSGIRAMRRLMKTAHLAPPTFESNRSGNSFTTILLLHNFLNPEDLKWLTRFDALSLNDAQKMALIFVRELGAIDNTTYRQFGDCDTLHASADLRKLKDHGLLEGKKGGRSTYYVATSMLLNPYGSPANPYGSPANPYGEAVNPYGDRTPRTYESLLAELPEEIKTQVCGLKKREKDPTVIYNLIEQLCCIRAYRLVDLSILLKRKQDTLAEYLKVLLDKKIVGYRFPEMIRHPDQAYLTVKENTK